MNSLKGHIVDVVRCEIFDGEIVIKDEKIVEVKRYKLPEREEPWPYIMPGFIDSHVHIESSMMVPHKFARIAVSHGTIGVIADPHEIGNVLGVEGVDYMIRSGKEAHFNFLFGSPSCVPATGGDLETCGKVIDAKATEELMAREDIGFLGEMMNYPGVLADDKEVMAKITAALRNGKPVDGHAPGLTGHQRDRYAAAGITTDHECSTLDEDILDFDFPNNFVAVPITAADINIDLKTGDTVHIIHASDGSLLTEHEEVELTGNPLFDSHYPWTEVQKIVVYNRYVPGAKPIVGLIRGFDIKNGAIAGSVAHDCHNIVAIGSTDEYLVKAINRIVEMQGGQVVVSPEEMLDIPLPIGGLMAPMGGHEIAFRTLCIQEKVRDIGCKMKSPFITMAFMCLPVIPDIKITDRHLIDTKNMKVIY